jgi:hypothetical protein
MLISGGIQIRRVTIDEHPVAIVRDRHVERGTVEDSAGDGPG